MHSYLREVTAEAGRPAAFGAGAHAADVLLAQDLVTSLWVGAPGQVGTALNIAPQECILVLQKIDTTHKFRLHNTGTEVKLLKSKKKDIHFKARQRSNDQTKTTISTLRKHNCKTKITFRPLQ